MFWIAISAFAIMVVAKFSPGRHRCPPLCCVGKFKIDVTFFAESDRAECLVIDLVVASRADSAAFIENSTEADPGPSEGLRRDLSPATSSMYP